MPTFEEMKTLEHMKSMLCTICYMEWTAESAKPLCEDCQTIIAGMVLLAQDEEEERRMRDQELMDRVGTPLGEIDYKLFI